MNTNHILSKCVVYDKKLYTPILSILGALEWRLLTKCRRMAQVVRSSAWFDSLAESDQKTLKVGIHSFPA